MRFFFKPKVIENQFLKISPAPGPRKKPHKPEKPQLTPSAVVLVWSLSLSAAQDV